MTRDGHAGDQRWWNRIGEHGISELVQRFRPVSRADFLTDLHRRGPAEALAGNRGRRVAWTHLGPGWHETVDDVANPATLPEVVERRSRERIHPAAPWATSAVAGLGSVVVVAGDNEGWVESLGVVGWIGVVGAVAAIAWRPRVRRRDRRYRVTGIDALTARAGVLTADVTRVATSAEAGAESDRLLLEIQGGARSLETLQQEAARSGLLGTGGRVEREPRNPAEQDLVTELLLVRAELLHDVLSLQVLAQQHGARSRDEDRAVYREVNDDLGQSSGPDLS